MLVIAVPRSPAQVAQLFATLLSTSETNLRCTPKPAATVPSVTLSSEPWINSSMAAQFDPAGALPPAERAAHDARRLDRFLAATERQALRRAEFATRNREDALDLVQDAMLRLARHYAQRPDVEWPLLFSRILTNGICDVVSDVDGDGSEDVSSDGSCSDSSDSSSDGGGSGGGLRFRDLEFPDSDDGEEWEQSDTDADECDKRVIVAAVDDASGGCAVRHTARTSSWRQGGHGQTEADFELQYAMQDEVSAGSPSAEPDASSGLTVGMVRGPSNGAGTGSRSSGSGGGARRGKKTLSPFPSRHGVVLTQSHVIPAAATAETRQSPVLYALRAPARGAARWQRGAAAAARAAAAAAAGVRGAAVLLQWERRGGRG
jgi:DNA-directed RNA polymerase specialized sigma24 family protein